MNSTKALIGLLLAGVAGIVIFLFVHLSNNSDDGGISIGSRSAAAACPRGQRDCLPDVNYVDTQGTAYTTQSLSGKVVVVNFWATWCKPCLGEIPDLSKTYEKYKSRGLVMLGVMTDDPDNNTLLNFQSDNEMTFPVVRATSDIMISYQNPSALPSTFIFDRGGRQVTKHLGPMRESQLDLILAPLIAQGAK